LYNIDIDEETLIYSRELYERAQDKLTRRASGLAPIDVRVVSFLNFESSCLISKYSSAARTKVSYDRER
jgi:phosphopantetheine adenylyltransferase